MIPLDPPCQDGKYVFLSKPRVQVYLDESMTTEVDVVVATLVFRRRTNEPIAYSGAFVDVWIDDRVTRVPYVHEVHGALVAQAQDRAIDACAEHDREPQTERRGAP